MNGDFIALLPKPNLAQLGTSAACPEHLQATTVFAFHCKEGVVIAGDHRATAGNIIFSDKTEKILELDSHSLMAIAGVPATAFEMARVLQTSFEYYRRSQLQSLSLPAKVRALARLLRENLPMTMQGIGVVILNATQYYNSNPPMLYATVLVAGAVGLCFYGLVFVAERLAVGEQRLKDA